MKQLTAYWHELKRQAEANPRLKWALVLVVALLCAFAWDGLDGLRQDMQKKAIDEEARLYRIRALQGQDIWLSRAEEASTLHAALLAELPQAATPGLAQATLQSWLRNLTESSASGRNLTVTVDSAAPMEAPEGLLRVHASISGGLPAAQALELLRRIESSSNLVVVETSTIRAQRDLVNFSLGINAFYRLPPTAEAGP